MSRSLHHFGDTVCSCSPLPWVFTALFGATAVTFGVLWFTQRREAEKTKTKGKGKGEKIAKLVGTAAKAFLI